MATPTPTPKVGDTVTLQEWSDLFDASTVGERIPRLQIGHAEFRIQLPNALDCHFRGEHCSLLRIDHDGEVAELALKFLGRIPTESRDVSQAKSIEGVLVEDTHDSDKESDDSDDNDPVSAILKRVILSPLQSRIQQKDK